MGDNIIIDFINGIKDATLADKIDWTVTSTVEPASPYPIKRNTVGFNAVINNTMFAIAYDQFKKEDGRIIDKELVSASFGSARFELNENLWSLVGAIEAYIQRKVIKDKEAEESLLKDTVGALKDN